CSQTRTLKHKITLDLWQSTQKELEAKKVKTDLVNTTKAKKLSRSTKKATNRGDIARKKGFVPSLAKGKQLLKRNRPPDGSPERDSSRLALDKTNYADDDTLCTNYKL